MGVPGTDYWYKLSKIQLTIGIPQASLSMRQTYVTMQMITHFLLQDIRLNVLMKERHGLV